MIRPFVAAKVAFAVGLVGAPPAGGLILHNLHEVGFVIAKSSQAVAAGTLGVGSTGLLGRTPDWLSTNG